MSAEFESNITSVERIREYIDQVEHEVWIGEEKIKPWNKKIWCNVKLNLLKKQPWVIEDTRPAPSWPDQGRVNFLNYSVKYREELDFVLKNINCNIQPSEKVSTNKKRGMVLFYRKIFIAV
jgi:ABC-type multidrug transport system fused ATPase/permease subunit